MRVTNRNEIHRRRLKWVELRKNGMRVKDIAALYNIDPSTVSNGVRRIGELQKIYGDAVLSDSWLRRATFSRRDGRIAGAMQKKRLKSKRNEYETK